MTEGGGCEWDVEGREGVLCFVLGEGGRGEVFLCVEGCVSEFTYV